MVGVVMPPRGYVVVYVKPDVYEQLALLKLRWRKRSMDEVIRELLRGRAGVATTVS
jgi:predicted CopG family antitoxin